MTDSALDPIAREIWDMKYRFKRADGTPIDQTVDDTWTRVAKALAQPEASHKRGRWERAFHEAMSGYKFLPAGRIVAGAGTGRKVTLFNCFVMGTLEDDMSAIFDGLREAALTMQQGGGIGHDFSTLRPKGAPVKGVGADASGPLSFMDVWDAMCRTIMSAGSRRGAMMATMRCHHPDIEDFITAKQSSARLRMFNLSVLVTNAFMDAVKADADWDLLFAGTVYRTVRARELWDRIMRSTFDFAEPGVIFIDRINEANNLGYCETIHATNPCGEQPLPPYGACLLGSVNLARLVWHPFSDRAHVCAKDLASIVTTAVRMLDNVVVINGLALPEQQQEIRRKRRHGMGFLGLGSTLTMLRIAYGTPASIAFTEQVSKELALAGWREGVELAKEKGAGPIFDEIFEVTETLLQKNPALAADYKLGDKIAGKVLHARYSAYMQLIAEEDPELVNTIAESGCRFTHHSSIAPTGTISLSLANNASNGIEPSFAHHYARNVIREGKKSKEKVDVFSFELLAYRTLINQAAMPYSQDPALQLPDYFVTSDDITPEQHVDVQAAAQRWVDSSISKIINVPSDIDFEDFKNIYLYAHSKGLKGCTTFRFNPEAFQGVLVKESDLENTQYRFTLEDGSKVELKGNDTVIYDGESHTAANLYDALKEGYYGKF